MFKISSKLRNLYQLNYDKRDQSDAIPDDSNSCRKLGNPHTLTSRSEGFTAHFRITSWKYGNEADVSCCRIQASFY